MGEFLDDEYDGSGVMTWLDGSEYDGRWKAGKWHGAGVYMNADGESRKGEWLDGANVKWYDSPEPKQPVPEKKAQEVFTADDLD